MLHGAETLHCAENRRTTFLRTTGNSGWLSKNSGLSSVIWSFYDFGSGVSLQVDEQNRPVTIEYDDKSEIGTDGTAGRLTRALSFELRVWKTLDKYTTAGNCGVITEEGPLDQPPDLDLHADIANRVPADEPIERWREQHTPLRIRNYWNLRRGGYVQYGSVRLSAEKEGGTGVIGSAIDLKGSTIVLGVPHGARLCLAQLYAGRYVIPINTQTVKPGDCGDKDYYVFSPKEMVEVVTHLTTMYPLPYLSWCDELLGH
jgi:hypothetical protein